MLACAAASFVMPASSAGAQMAAQSPALAGIAHAALRVSDLVKTRDFYEKLGFEEAFAMSRDGAPTESFLKINDRQFIELYPQREPAQTIGFMHVCFEANDLARLNATYMASGLSPTPVKRAGAGNLLFTMVGPEKQNIEYTQYMPGSKHTEDRGKHLGANRISAHLVGLSVEMDDPGAAREFYEQKLGFHSARHDLRPGAVSLDLPGGSGQKIEIAQKAAGSAFELVFGVASVKKTGKQLKSLQIPVEKRGGILVIHDPDGNRVLFLKFTAQ